MTRVRVRGIYATALTERLREAVEVVQASDPIERRFASTFEQVPHDVAVETTDDRQGVGVVGRPNGVAEVVETLREVGIDAFAWRDDAPRGAIFEAVATETLGGGAVVDLGSREGYLPFDAATEHVREGETYRVQVREPAPPWGDRRPEVSTEIRAFGGMVDLVRGGSGTSADVGDPERADELARVREVLPTEVPEGWGVRWNRGAGGAGMDALDDALSLAVDRIDAVEDALEGGDPPERTDWVRFGRESRFELDEVRDAVVGTMPGHHRIKAGGDGASAAVDFVERLCDPGDLPTGEAGFPFEATVEQFGPSVDEHIEIMHAKPDGRAVSLGEARVTDRDGTTVTVRRDLAGGGTYDALDTPKESGDVAVTKLAEGRWWYPTTYRGDGGSSKGTYVNVCTPVEVFPGEARYVDLHVDVVKRPDGEVERVDEDELTEAVAAGEVSEALAGKARSVAAAVERALT